LASGILHQPGIAWSEGVSGAVTQADFDPTGDADYILAAGRWVPIYESARFVLREADLGGFDGFSQFWMRSQTGLFDVGLAVVACVHSVDAHVYPPLDDNCPMKVVLRR
jgi:hypothetical protein